MRRASLLVLLLVLAACGGGSDSTDESFSKRDDGAFTVYELSDPGFSLGVPKSWTTITRDELRETGAVERFTRDNPAVAPMLEGVLQPDSPMKFVALAPSADQGFVTNVNVVVQDVPDDMELQDLERSSAQELEALGVVSGLETSTVSLPAGSAVKLSYRMQLRYGTATRNVATLQYAFLHNGRSYVVTYSTVPALASGYASTFADSAESLRLDE